MFDYWIVSSYGTYGPFSGNSSNSALPSSCGNPTGIPCGGTGATTAAGANLNITGVTQTGTLGTSSQVSTFPGTVAAESFNSNSISITISLHPHCLSAPTEATELSQRQGAAAGGISSINSQVGPAITIQSSGATVAITNPSPNIINLESSGGSYLPLAGDTLTGNLSMSSGGVISTNTIFSLDNQTTPVSIPYGLSTGPLTAGTLTANSIFDNNIAPSTLPICPNGGNGAFTTTGCSGGGGSYLPLAGGTLTGHSTTSASFSGTVAAGSTTPTTIGANGVLLNGVPALQSQTSLFNYYSGGAGNLTGTGYDNTANGFAALFFNTTGYNNTANGFKALYTNTTGGGNTANGLEALYFNTTGYNNTANGFAALNDNTTGIDNTANGFAALYDNTTGTDNTANGFQALYSNTTGNNNTANGFQALNANTTGSSNTANGFEALYSNTTGSNNTANGYAGALLQHHRLQQHREWVRGGTIHRGWRNRQSNQQQLSV